MARHGRKTNALETAIALSYTKHAAGKQIDIMKIGAVYADAKAAVIDGKTLDEAMPAIVARYCEPT